MSKIKPIEIEIKPDSSSLYIFFGGIAKGIAMPPFEFYSSAKIINENKIFIRDFSQCWYHNGLPGIGKDLCSTADFIEKEINKINPENLFFVGNSMGGYAAILFASLIGRGEVIAFAPQTFISPFLRLKNGDRRWSKQIFSTYRRSFFKTKVWDLKSLLYKKNLNLKIYIFVSKEYNLDYMHALHVRGIPGVRVIEVCGGGHEVVRMLRDKGELSAIMSGSYP